MVLFKAKTDVGGSLKETETAWRMSISLGGGTSVVLRITGLMIDHPILFVSAGAIPPEGYLAVSAIKVVEGSYATVTHDLHLT